MQDRQVTALHVLILVACSLLAATTGCKKKAATEATTTPAKEIRKVVPVHDNACGFLKNEDIKEIQGSPVKETKGDGHSDGRLRILQCYFGTEESNRSVSLMITQTDPAGSDKAAARTAWAETFGRYANEEKETEAEKEKKESLREQKRGGEEEEGKMPLKKVEGVGEQAFWVGSRVGGALYILKNNASIRLSIGGPDNEEEKIKKTKALAEKALGRL